MPTSEGVWRVRYATADVTEGNTELVVREFPVKVLAESDGMAAVEESLKGSRLAYMEDRPLSNGVTVLGGSK